MGAGAPFRRRGALVLIGQWDEFCSTERFDIANLPLRNEKRRRHGIADFAILSRASGDRPSFRERAAS